MLREFKFTTVNKQLRICEAITVLAYAACLEEIKAP